MSENTMHLQIVTPHGLLYDAPSTGVRLESAMGQIELLPDHEPIIAGLTIGAALVKREEGELYFALNHGFAEVLNNRIEIVVESAEEASTLDVPRAEAARDRAIALLKEIDPSTHAELASQIDADLRLATLRISVGSQH